jgi:hypothetical protein
MVAASQLRLDDGTFTQPEAARSRTSTPTISAALWFFSADGGAYIGTGSAGLYHFDLRVSALTTIGMTAIALTGLTALMR